MKIVPSNYVGPDHIYRSRFTTVSFETDPHFQARLGFYFGIVQELAGAHSAWAKLSMPETLREGKTWVILRTRMHVDRYTTWPEDIMGETWVHQPNGFHFLRSFRGIDEDGKVLFFGSSQWAFLDVAKNFRPIRPTEVMDRFPVPLETDTAHGQMLELPRHAPDYDSVGAKPICQGSPRILLTDTDGNHHVNNLSYVHWALNTLPHEFLMTHKVRDIDVSWLRQTHIDDEVTVYAGSVQDDPLHQSEPEIFFKIMKGNETAWTGVTRWAERSGLVRDGLYSV